MLNCSTDVLIQMKHKALEFEHFSCNLVYYSQDMQLENGYEQNLSI